MRSGTFGHFDGGDTDGPDVALEIGHFTAKGFGSHKERRLTKGKKRRKENGKRKQRRRKGTGRGE